MQDDLVNMMSQHLQLNPVQHQQDASMPPTPQVSPQSAPITYITQHYHHSAHQAGTTDSQASSDLESVGINAAVLLPTQLALFKNADPEQRQRLVELWRIAPPTYGNQLMPGDMGNWPQTSMEKEEEAARHRWEESERERLKNLCALPGYDNRGQAEPYIVSGYNDRPNINGVTALSEYTNTQQSSSEYKRCKDPVYNSSREWWQLTDEEPMEHQYGMLQAMMYGNGIEYAQPPRHDDEDEEML
jgi:hypothetical protein